MFVAPPGVGKTVIGTYLVAARACSTLILVHRTPLLDQCARAARAVSGRRHRRRSARSARGKERPTGALDVAMIQSLVRRETIADLVAGYGQVIVDECHHLPAVSFERVVAAAKARYVVGLTATPQRRDGHHPDHGDAARSGAFHGRCEDAGRCDARSSIDSIVRETAFRPPTARRDDIQELYARSRHDEPRNRMILNDVIARARGRAFADPAHGAQGSPRVLRRASWRASFVTWSFSRAEWAPSKRATCVARMAAIPSRAERLVLATGRYIGEGFDDARLDTLFLALPVSWKGTLVQYTGRLHRLHPGKREVRIYDYVDREVPMLLHMFEKRLRGYRAIGYARGRGAARHRAPEGADDRVRP